MLELSDHHLPVTTKSLRGESGGRIVLVLDCLNELLGFALTLSALIEVSVFTHRVRWAVGMCLSQGGYVETA